MSRTSRSTDHWSNWQRNWWTEEWRLRCRRGHDSICELCWPMAGGWFADWMDDVAACPNARRWLKRYNSKFRRRQARRDIEEQLEQLY